LDTVILTSDDEWDPSQYNDTVSVRERLKNMAEMVPESRNLEYTSSSDVILIQSGETPDTPKRRRLSRKTPSKPINRKMRRILEHPTSWKDPAAATYDVISL